MKEEPMTKEVARRYLLGAVDDLERQQIESLFMTDPKDQETIVGAEEELLEDYFEGSLSESDLAKFLEQYAKVPRQQRRLRIAAAIREYALSEAERDKGSPSVMGKLRNLISSPVLRERRLYIPVAVTLMVLVIAGIWLVQWNNQRQRDADLRLALERELTDLNSPSNLNQNRTQMLSLVLPPVALRSINQSSQVVSQSAHQIIELHLLLTHKRESQSYTAVLRRVGSTDEITVANLRAEKGPANSVVRLRLPSKSLSRGHYLVSLSGVPDGLTQQYEFVIAG